MPRTSRRRRQGSSRSFSNPTLKKSATPKVQRQSAQTAGVPQPKNGGVISGIAGAFIGSAAGSMVGHALMNELAEERTAPKECQDDLKLFLKCYDTKPDDLQFCMDFADKLQKCKESYEDDN